jgi:hypothetical protein
LQGLVRDLERAQLMAREMKANSGRKDYVRFSALLSMTDMCLVLTGAVSRSLMMQESQYERLNENTNRLLRYDCQPVSRHSTAA